jgi:two-component system copper resistance phosphate regulon response regulator CusR
VGCILHILYIEDNATAREFVKLGLESHGIEVELCADGAEGLRLGRSSTFDMILLDLGLPSMDGLEVLTRMREADVETPIMVLSARSHTVERIEGLDLGADDYLGKPFALEELAARIRAIRRRVKSEMLPNSIEISGLTLDAASHTAARAGSNLELTPKEFALLELLMRNEGRVLSRSLITERVWGPAFEVSAHVISVHINHLRRKVDKGYDNRLIHTVTGVGYILEDRGRA